MGGGKNVRTKLSLRYDKNTGLYANRNFERYIARLNNDLDINPYLEAHVDANFAYGKVTTPHNNPFESGARNIPPIYAAYWRNGNYGDVKDGENILAKINEGGTIKASDYSIAAKGELVVKPLKGLRISLVAAPNFTFHNVKDFNKEVTYTRADDPLTPAGHVGGFRTTSLTETRNTHYDITTQALANYTHDFDCTASQQWQVSNTIICATKTCGQVAISSNSPASLILISRREMVETMAEMPSNTLIVRLSHA